MANRFDIYKCDICGMIVEVLEGAGGKLHCCGQEMTLLEAKTADMSTEKHVPYKTKKCKKYTVKVGKETDHPMADDHYIMWIDIYNENELHRKFLKPGEEPVAEFRTEANDLKAREYCNKHGLWQD